MLTARSADMALPQQATHPPYRVDLIAVARMSPPTVSTTPPIAPSTSVCPSRQLFLSVK
mgnify:CR=1 FL=1